MQTCHISVENAFGKKLNAVTATANPNIGWWNGGSQIYGWPLVSARKFMETGEYKRTDGEGIFAQPFKGTSDEKGQITMELPVGRTCLWVGNDKFHLPAKLGGRDKRIEVKKDETLDLKLVLQPKGLDVLGDWEDLCGLVFG